jgi:uncharacterized protein with HEPN domain
MLPEEWIRVRHMIEAAEDAMQFAASRKREELEDDRMLAFALTRAVEIIGEAATRISPATRAELARIPWSQIVGMRNRLIHAYLEVDNDILWTTVTQRLPELVLELRRLLPLQEG